MRRSRSRESSREVTRLGPVVDDALNSALALKPYSAGDDDDIVAVVPGLSWCTSSSPSRGGGKSQSQRVVEEEDVFAYHALPAKLPHVCPTLARECRTSLYLYLYLCNVVCPMPTMASIRVVRARLCQPVAAAAAAASSHEFARLPPEIRQGSDDGGDGR
nr:hypothetical protein CFP56_68645 [Quercus suber]